MPPRARESWRPRNNVFITLHPFGSPAAPRAPTPAGRLRARPAEPAFLDFFYLSTQIKTPWLQEGGLPSRRPRPPRGSPGERVGAAGGQARGGGGGTSWAAGRVRGLGPHERRLRPSLQPREQGPGFKGRLQTNPCYPQDARASAEPRARTRQPAPRLRPGVRGALST